MIGETPKTLISVGPGVAASPVSRPLPAMKFPTMKAVLNDRGLRVGPDDEGCFGGG
jgi:hypothetical protein